MRPYKCQVCGETYLGEHPPDRCPFCGAAGSEMKKAALWYDRGQVQMSQQSRDNLNKALGLEIRNVAFYKCASDHGGTHITKAIFKRLSKQEMEHAELICKALGINIPSVEQAQCKGNDGENFIEAHQYEDEAIKFYLQAAQDALKSNESEVAYIFRALAEIETEHLILSNSYK